MKELVGHSVNSRKQVSPSLDRLLPEESFRLFAIATRFPEKLAGKITLHPQGIGVYYVAWGAETIRVLVLNEIPAADRNTILNLFSAEPKRIVAGVSRYRRAPHESSSVLTALLTKYHGDPDMPQTLAELIRDTEDRVIADISRSRFVEKLSLEQLQETQDLIARRIAAFKQQKPASPPVPKGRRKTGTTERLSENKPAEFTVHSSAGTR